MLRTFLNFFSIVWRSYAGKISLIVFTICMSLAVLGPIAAPYGPTERVYDAAGNLVRLAPPSWDHWLGTTLLGRDVWSQMLWGARPALTIGLLTALGTVVIGVNVGLLAGYLGGAVDSFLMRLTDIFLGLPFLPFIIVLLSLTGQNIWTIILAMMAVMWRSTARIVRAEVLSLRERQFIAAARTTGASDFDIIYREIAPNVMPFALVGITFALAWAIITEASIGFLGFGDPNVVSWGSIIYDAYASQMMYRAPWWVVPPGIAIMILVTSVYFMGRAYEEVVNPRIKQAG
ncbi:peptide/nickel transport system permease protein [Maritalea mobilis]|jgi:peptide/nickel transport system permease protein|uniref:Peptide/nickel transport system permease protein n=1 Tax=Maritalea mobilis TaxID=483324 RepID=A0A4R6VW02_9HYPH|nr:ABC transporter permease [Maritalea mobilis]TDQ64451.1 peptide/nickel transport system permease protein [Maritalea mobilis]